MAEEEVEVELGVLTAQVGRDGGGAGRAHGAGVNEV
jgi:hypothetical protein